VRWPGENDGLKLSAFRTGSIFDGRVGGRFRREIPQLRNAEENSSSLHEKGLGFLVGADLREGRAGGFTVEAGENFLEDGEVRGADGIFARSVQ